MTKPIWGKMHGRQSLRCTTIQENPVKMHPGRIDEECAFKAAREMEGQLRCVDARDAIMLYKRVGDFVQGRPDDVLEDLLMMERFQEAR